MGSETGIVTTNAQTTEYFCRKKEGPAVAKEAKEGFLRAEVLIFKTTHSQKT